MQLSSGRFPAAFRRGRRLLFLLSAVGIAAACGGSSNPASPTPASVPFSQTDLRVGTGREAVAGTRVTVHYTGWLYDAGAPEQKGRQFETSVGRQPLTFVLGAGQVIRGWDMGFGGMRVGGLRRLVIPAEFAYGATGAGGGVIPPNAALVFEIELVDVQG